jgi:hypothetical protein
MGKTRQPSTKPMETSAQVVTQQLARRWERGWCPRRDGRHQRVGVQVQQRAKGDQACHAVGDGVMGAQEQAHLVVWQAGQQPGLP